MEARPDPPSILNANAAEFVPQARCHAAHAAHAPTPVLPPTICASAPEFKPQCEESFGLPDGSHVRSAAWHWLEQNGQTAPASSGIQRLLDSALERQTETPAWVQVPVSTLQFGEAQRFMFKRLKDNLRALAGQEKDESAREVLLRSAEVINLDMSIKEFGWVVRDCHVNDFLKSRCYRFIKRQLRECLTLIIGCAVFGNPASHAWFTQVSTIQCEQSFMDIFGDDNWIEWTLKKDWSFPSAMHLCVSRLVDTASDCLKSRALFAGFAEDIFGCVSESDVLQSLRVAYELATFGFKEVRFTDKARHGKKKNSGQDLQSPNCDSSACALAASSDEDGDNFIHSEVEDDSSEDELLRYLV